MWKNLSKAFAIVVLIGAIGGAVTAASATGGSAIVGTVTGPDGASVASANVRLTNVFNGSTVATTTSDKKGAYQFASLASGTYGVVATKKDEPCAISDAIMLGDDSTLLVDLQMKDKALCTGALTFATPP